MELPKSTKLTVDFRGAKIQFGIHKATGQYRKKHKGRNLYLGAGPAGVLERWIEKTDDIEAEESGVVERIRFASKEMFVSGHAIGVRTNKAFGTTTVRPDWLSRSIYS